jgi:hypothetical protein
LKPEDVSCGSNKKVWWKCKHEHEWETLIYTRTSNNNCPYCSHQKISKDESLAVKYPELSKEWHPTKNGNLTPYDFAPRSNKKAWWKYESCEWESVIWHRTKAFDTGNKGLPQINALNLLSVKCPTLSEEWHPIKNGELKPHDVSYKSSKKVWWKCINGHEWETSISSRSRLDHIYQCPYCCNQKVNEENCLAVKNKIISKEWHPTKNGDLTPSDVTNGSQKRVWWKCINGHEWETYVSVRTGQQTQCPYCRGVDLKDGTHCDSVPEAFMYLKYIKEGRSFLHNKSYGGELASYKYDFYFIDTNTYVEVTSYHNNFHGYYKKGQYVSYLRKIVKKRKYVKNVLNANFEFIQFTPNRSQRKEVLNNRKST